MYVYLFTETIYHLRKAFFVRYDVFSSSSAELEHQFELCWACNVQCEISIGNAFSVIYILQSLLVKYVSWNTTTAERRLRSLRNSYRDSKIQCDNNNNIRFRLYLLIRWQPSAAYLRLFISVDHRRATSKSNSMPVYIPVWVYHTTIIRISFSPTLNTWWLDHSDARFDFDFFFIELESIEHLTCHRCNTIVLIITDFWSIIRLLKHTCVACPYFLLTIRL